MKPETQSESLFRLLILQQGENRIFTLRALIRPGRLASSAEPMDLFSVSSG